MTLSNIRLNDFPIDPAQSMTPEALKTWRKAHRLDQQEAADLLGLHKNGYAKMERGGVERIKPIYSLAIWTLENLPHQQGMKPYSAEELRAWRKRLNLTQIDAAALLGLNSSYLSRLEIEYLEASGRPSEISKALTLACVAIEHQNRVLTPLKDRMWQGEPAESHAAV